MAVIVKNMRQVPAKCEDCDFLVYMRDFDADYEYPWCPYLANDVDISQRPKECPLKEIKL